MASSGSFRFRSRSIIEQCSSSSTFDRSLSSVNLMLNIQSKHSHGAPRHIDLEKYRYDHGFDSSFISHRFIANRGKMDFERANMILVNHDLSSEPTQNESLDNSLAHHAISDSSLIEPGGIYHSRYVRAVRELAEIRNRNERKRHIKRLQQRGPILVFEQDQVTSTPVVASPKRPEFSNPDPYLLERMMDNRSRRIVEVPDRVLDAPGLIEDFYLNLLDWSPSNQIGLALHSRIFLYSAETGDLQTLDTSRQGHTITSFRFSRQNQMASAALTSGQIDIFDLETLSPIHTLNSNQFMKVCALDWNGPILASGNSMGTIQLEDVRLSNSYFSQIKNAHPQIVCNVRWSPCNRFLASGSNFNDVRVWDVRYICDDFFSSFSNNEPSPRPLFTIKSHKAAVKAIAWCPWRYNFLGTGGGTADRRVILTNVSTEKEVLRINTQSQVSGIEFSHHYPEFVTSHGFSSNQLYVWRYEQNESFRLRKVSTLDGHSGRILSMTISPDKQSVATVGADQRLKIWNCFQCTEKPIVPLENGKGGAVVFESIKPKDYTSPMTMLRTKRLAKLPHGLNQKQRQRLKNLQIN